MGVLHLSDLQSSIDFIINSGSGYFAYEMEKQGFILNDGQVLELASGVDHSSLSESERIKYNVMTYTFTGSELDLRIYNKLSPAQYKQLVNFLQRYKGLIDLIEIDFYQGRSLVFTGEYYSVTEVIGALQQLVKGNIPKKGYFSGIFRGGKHRMNRYRKKAIRSEKGYTFEEAQVYARALSPNTNIRWVLGTRTGLWYPIKPDDRDYYVWGIPNNEFIEMTEDEALRNQNTYRVLHSSSTKRKIRRIGKIQYHWYEKTDARTVTTKGNFVITFVPLAKGYSKQTRKGIKEVLYDYVYLGVEVLPSLFAEVSDRDLELVEERLKEYLKDFGYHPVSEGDISEVEEGFGSYSFIVAETSPPMFEYSGQTINSIIRFLEAKGFFKFLEELSSGKHEASTKREGQEKMGGKGTFDKWMDFFDYYKKRGEIDFIQEKAFKLGKEKGKEDSLGLKDALLNVLETTQEKDSKKLLFLAIQSIDNRAEYQQIKSWLLTEIQEKAPEFYNEKEILETLDKFWKGYFSGLSLTDPDWLEGLMNKQSSVKKLSSIVRR